MPKLCLPLALVLLIAALPANASHIVGIKVVATDVNPATRSVDVDFTMYSTEGFDLRGPSNTTYVDLFWGDGEGTGEAEATLVSTAGPNVFRGSMSHTYEEGDVEESGGDFTIRVRQCCKSEFISSEELVTGRLNEYPEFSGSPGSMRGSPETVTNTTMISFDSVLEVPTASGMGLLLLSALLGVGGLVLLRR